MLLLVLRLLLVLLLLLALLLFSLPALPLLPASLLPLLLGFFWLLPSSSLLNEHMGNCAIERTAYIGGVLLLMQVFFDNLSGKQEGKPASTPRRAPARRESHKKAAPGTMSRGGFAALRN